MMNDWRKPCEHGRYDSHILNPEIFGTPNRDPDPMVCPGGSPVTTADLEEALKNVEASLGERVWWCESHRSVGLETICDGAELVRTFHEPESPCRIVERLLLPIPDPQPATEVFVNNDFVNNDDGDFDD